LPPKLLLHWRLPDASSPATNTSSPPAEVIAPPPRSTLPVNDPASAMCCAPSAATNTAEVEGKLRLKLCPPVPTSSDAGKCAPLGPEPAGSVGPPKVMVVP